MTTLNAGAARAMRATGADVSKLAVKTTRLSDCLPLVDLGGRLARDGASVVIGMGEQGLPSRVFAGRFGSAWTYAGSDAEIGQVTATHLIVDYRFRALTDSTDLYGVAGSPVRHSVSPAMHNAAFAAARLDAVYLPLAAADAQDLMTFGQGFGLKGVSVTIPFKVSLFDRMDEAHAVARRIGAINTIRVVGGRWLGSNTDASGFLQPLQERGVSLRGMRVAILGAGGSARAVAVGAASGAASISVHARDASRAAAVAMLVSGSVGEWPVPAGSWDLLVNCTPVGMHPHAGDTPVPAKALTGQIVYDLVYNPTATRLLRDAAAAGCQTIGGLEMLVAQAHEQFHWWTDIKPPAGVMRAAAVKRLAEFTAS